MKDKPFSVGDKVRIVNRGGWGGLTASAVRIVSKVSKLGHVTLEGGDAKYRQDGSQVGTSNRWSGSRLEHETAELAAEIKEAVAIRDAVALCRKAAEALGRLRGDDAVRIAAMIPADLLLALGVE